MRSSSHLFQSTLLPATVNVNRLATFRHHFKAGSMFTFSRFDMTWCNKNYRLSDSPLSIRFMLFNQLSMHVIGELTAVKSTVIDVLQGKERVMATIKLGHLLECHFPTKRLMQGRTLTVGTSSSGLIYKRWT
ncbi:unnamed protein product [Brassica rapa subsp. narinosa]|uniref:Uncharacterized protein n=1 Tax=Brassica campestris TaxID=3711 RepID=M4DR32_BRACM